MMVRQAAREYFSPVVALHRRAVRVMQSRGVIARVKDDTTLDAAEADLSNAVYTACRLFEDLVTVNVLASVYFTTVLVRHYRSTLAR